MIRILRHTLWLLAAATLAACSKEVPGYDPPALADRTVLLYMPGQSLIAYYEKQHQEHPHGRNGPGAGQGRMLVCRAARRPTSAVMQEIWLRQEQAVQRGQDAQNLRRFRRRRSRSGAAAVRRCRGSGSGPKLRIDHRLSRQGVDSREAAACCPLDAPGRRRVDDGAGAKQTRSFGDTGYELDITASRGARSPAVPFRLPDLRRLFHGQYRDVVRPAPCGGLYRSLSLRDHGRRFPLRPDRPPPVRRKRRVRRSRKKPAGSSGTSTRTTGTPSRETNSRGASRWPSRRNRMR